MNSDPSAVQFVLTVIGIPLVIIGVIALLVLAPGWTRAGRYRPGDSWDHDPVMIGTGGSQPAAELLSAKSPAELTAGSSAAPTAAQAESDSTTPGGISVRW